MSKKVEYAPTDAEYEYNFLKDSLSEYWENIAINILEIDGLKEIIKDNELNLTSEMIMKYLYENGQCLFFKDEVKGYMCLKVAPASQQNVYGKYTKYRATGVNYSKEYDLDHAVLIKNNPLCKATKPIIDYYCGILADIELTKNLRRDAHKTPYELECTADTELTAKNYYKKIKAREPAIYKNKTRGEYEIGVKVVDNDVAYINDKLDDEYNSVVAKILTILGLDNFVEDKAERVQSAEVESNQEYIIASFRTKLEELKKALDNINTMFGTNLKVKYVEGEQIDDTEKTEEDKENEQIHS